MISRLSRAWPVMGLAALLPLLLWQARPVQAHAAFVRSDPSPNSVLSEHVHQITIWFSEPLEPDFSEIQVFNSQGEQVDAADSQVVADDPTTMYVSLPTLPDGTYTVAWRNVSTVDGHALRGSFVISFGEPLSGAAGATTAEATAERSLLESLARGWLLVGAMAVVGGLVFELLILRPVFLPKGGEAMVAAVGTLLISRSRRLIWLALALFAGASLLQMGQQAATIFELPATGVGLRHIDALLFTTQWGYLWLARMVLFGIATFSLGLAPQPTDLEEAAIAEDTVTRAGRLVALLAGMGFMLTISLTSHAAATAEIRAAAVFSDYLHLLAAAFWIGGLFHFATSARPLYRALPARRRRTLLAALVPRFSTLALLSVGTLVITGLYSTWAQVGIVPALVTPYGLTLLAKLALFLPMLVLGALNLLRIGPRLGREDLASFRLRRAVSMEAVLGLSILLLVGLLTSLEPARQFAARAGLGQGGEQTFQETVERTDISLTVEPAVPGNNRFLVELADPQGRPIVNAAEVLLELTYLDADLGEIAATAQPVEPGQYEAEEVLLSVAGDWQVGVLVRRPDAFDARSAFRFAVVAGGSGAPERRAGYILWGIELVLLGSLFLAAAFLPGQWYKPPALITVVPGGAALLIGLALALGSPFLLRSGPQTVRNPIPPDAESIANGRALYEEYCAPCHGASGRGDGPLAAELELPPADLVQHVPLHPDADLFAIIQDGVPDTPMPAFEASLTEEQIWHLINYLRTLSFD